MCATVCNYTVITVQNIHFILHSTVYVAIMFIMVFEVQHSWRRVAVYKWKLVMQRTYMQSPSHKVQMM